ncbi:hypothetical protein DMC47_34860 [Nostoc sp. 3335mG]|nr:hypothetical protein DMC47_34860 [Nostoc sp. 3335mG]
MIDWLLSNHRHFVRFSRWIVAACATALVGIAGLPRTPFDRLAAIIGVSFVALIMLVWLVIVLVTILRPRIFAELRQRRAEAAARKIGNIFR